MHTVVISDFRLSAGERTAVRSVQRQLPLGQNTAAMSVTHHDGTLQYDSHNIYGLQVEPTYVEAVCRVYRSEAA